MKEFEVIIIGASAAGLMCAIEAGKRNRHVIVFDHANKVGKKILMSGGGRCNFTNYYVSPEKYISHNPHFCKSALKRYTQWDFVELVKKHGILFHEKTKGQLFCDNRSQDIVNMLLSECSHYNIEIHLNTRIIDIEKRDDNSFNVKTIKGDFHSKSDSLSQSDNHSQSDYHDHSDYRCQSLVIATGGLSIPTMGASPFGYKIAEQFGIKVWPTRAGLVPLTLHSKDKEKLSPLSGISVDCIVHNTRQSFRENILFTHRGLSGPAILQISSYWEPGEEIKINLLPDTDCAKLLNLSKNQSPQKQIKNVFTELLPKRLVEVLFEDIIKLHLEDVKKLNFDDISKLRTLNDISTLTLHDFSKQELSKIGMMINEWSVKPNGTEGYRTAEVTLGGVDCDALSSKTMQANDVLGLYFVGEVVDVTGWLGGYNFQWAWSSGYAAGQVV